MTETPPRDKRARPRLFGEFWMLARFGVVGLVATAVHMVIVWHLVRFGIMPTLFANLLAFLSAFAVSFAGHYRWTFGPQVPARDALRRFFLIAISAFAANSLLLSALLDVGWLAPAVAAIAAASIVPLLSYLLSRCWVFRAPVDGSSLRTWR